MYGKPTFLTFLFLAIVFSASANKKPDTTDHWTVSYNTKTLAKLDAGTPDKLIVIRPQLMLPKDVLGLDFWCDAPCNDCATEIYMGSSKKVQLAKARGSGTRLSVNIVKLFNAWRDNGMKPIGIYYADGHRNEPVFIVTFSN